MTARVYIRQKNLAGEVATVEGTAIDGQMSSTTLQFINADSAIGGNAPLVRPAIGLQRSYEKWLRLYIGSPSPSGSITAPKFYTSGSAGTGVTIYARTTNASAYSTPTIPANDSAGTNITNYTSASPKAMDAVNAGPFSTANADFGDYLVLWMTIGPTATLSSRQQPISVLVNFFFSWSET